jgi:hypothetical protein
MFTELPGTKTLFLASGQLSFFYRHWQRQASRNFNRQAAICHLIEYQP